MPTPKIQVAPERIAEGKHLYELTATPVPDIAAMMGISRRTLERRVDEWGWARRSAPRIAADRAHVAAPPGGATAGAIAPPTREAIAERILITVNSELDAVHRVLEKVDPADKGEAERSARTLASISRALQELTAIMKPDGATPPDDTDNDDDPVPRDIDAFRDALARRIEEFIEAESGGESAADAETV
jgi:hypothetical protein